MWMQVHVVKEADVMEPISVGRRRSSSKMCIA